MTKMKSNFRNLIKYRLPKFKLCLVKEGTGDFEPFPIRTPQDAACYLEPLQHASEEYFVSLHLNARHEVIGLHEVSHGTVSASLVHPREVFKCALLSNSYAILVCHNHPSGSRITASREDLETTEQLVKASDLLGVNLIDHLIVGPSRQVYSLRENYPEIWQKTAIDFRP